MLNFFELRNKFFSTENSRAKQRHKKVAFSAISSVAAKSIQILTSLISIPITINYLGIERYGLWMTITSVISVLSFSDLGIGNGLLNMIAESDGKDDRDSAAKAVSSSFMLLTALAFILTIIFSISYPYISWAKLFNISNQNTILEAGPAMAVFVACFLINLPLGIVQRVQMGYQEGYVSNIWLCAGNLISLAGILIVVHYKMGLPWLIFAMSGATILVTFINGIVLFSKRYPWLRPRISNFSITIMKRVLKIGLLFFFLQLAVSLGYSSDNIVLAQILGLNAVSQYAVPMRMFQIVPLLLGFVFAPLWPAYGEAIARGDIGWVTLTLKRSICLGLLVNIPFAMILVVFGSKILELWIGHQVSTPFPLMLGLGIWMALNSIGGPISSFFNGASIIKFQVICALTMGIMNLIISIFLVKAIGISGVVYGSIISQIIFNFIPTIIYIPKVLKSLENKAALSLP